MLEHKIEIQERLKFRTETYLKKKMKYKSLYNIVGSETVDAEREIEILEFEKIQKQKWVEYCIEL